jgi:hypothetical protein
MGANFLMRRAVTVLLLLTSLLVRSSTPFQSAKTVHVREYTRKDGTVVHAHDRAALGTASHATTPHTPASATAATIIAPTTTEPAATAPTTPTECSSTVIKRNSHGRIERSGSAKRNFEASHPCPSTGSTSGPCKGYVIDHVKALACGGADAPENMQWQTAAAAKAKDKVERVGCYAP